MKGLQKIILGTAQFGLDYGIGNTSGKVGPQEVSDILQLCRDYGITALDTADVYGDAQEVLAKQRLEGFQIYSKFSFSARARSIRPHLEKTLERLGVKFLQGYYFHRFGDFVECDGREIAALKAEGLLAEVGVSLYSEGELQRAIDTPWLDVIQLPFNLLDCSEARIALFASARSRGKKIFVRSLFLQGLLLMNPDTLPKNVSPLRPYLVKIHELARSNGVTVNELCLAYPTTIQGIDRVVIGVESASQLRGNFDALKNSRVQIGLFADLPRVEEKHRILLNPVHWS